MQFWISQPFSKPLNAHIDFMIYPMPKDVIIMFMAKEIMFYYKSNKYNLTVFRENCKSVMCVCVIFLVFEMCL